MKNIAAKRRLLQLASNRSYIVGEREGGRPKLSPVDYYIVGSAVRDILSRPKTSPIEAVKTGFDKAELLLQADNKKEIDALHKVVLVRKGFIHQDFNIPIRMRNDR